MVNLLSLNVRSIKTDLKQTLLCNFLKRLKSDIVFLQETNLIEPPTSTYLVANMNMAINPSVQISSGTAIFAKSFSFDSATILVPGYAQVACAHYQNKFIHLINVYLSHNTELASETIHQLEMYLSRVQHNHFIVLGGDWNCTLEPIDRAGSIERRAVIVNKLKSLFTDEDLSDAWREQHPVAREFTYVGTHQLRPRARLDRFYLRKSLISSVSFSKLIPSFSDHSAAVMTLDLNLSRTNPPYWKLNNSLLDDSKYTSMISNIIAHFVQKQEDCNCLILWDELKTEVRLATQRYESYQRHVNSGTLLRVERQLRDIQSKLVLCTSEQIELNRHVAMIRKNHYDNAKATSVVENSSNLQYGNSMSPMFYQLGKKKQPIVRLDCVKINGTSMTDKQEINQHIRNHFQNLYSQTGTNVGNAPCLYSDLPTLSVTDRDFLDSPLTEIELRTSTYQLTVGKAPGLDGLSANFYRVFWEKLSPLLMKVVQYAFETHSLPRSMQLSVISLIPKPGDPALISSWRPISLLNTDYKIISRAISNRLSNVLKSIIHSDQSYCVNGRSMFTNLHLMRDAIELANKENIPLAIVSLDQANAFDHVDHKYLFMTMKAFGIGDCFMNFVQTLYDNARCTVRVSNTLTRPFPFQRGIRQGDPLSGCLYTISIEPFLMLCQRNLSPYGLKIPRSMFPLVSTAYADDVSIFITNDHGFTALDTAFTLYGCASGAKLNTDKTKGLFTGSWKSRIDKPMTQNWNSEGLCFLGVFLGNSTSWETRNWDTLTAKIKGGIERWAKWNFKTSLRGRRIVANQLLGSKLVHVLTVLEPPKKFVEELHRILIRFLWNGRHWKSQDHVFADPREGGLGLTNIFCRAATYRLRALTKFLSPDVDRNAHFHLQEVNFNRYAPDSDFCTSVLQPIRTDWLHRLQPFYRSIVKYWDEICPATTNNSCSPLDSLDFIDTTNARGLYHTLRKKLVPGSVLSKTCVWMDNPVQWMTLYQYPTSSADGDICWRLMYDCVGYPVKLHRWGIRDTSACPWCPSVGTSLHLVYECFIVKLIWTYTISKIRKLVGDKYVKTVYLIGGIPPNCDPLGSQLSNFLINLCKTTIHRAIVKEIDERTSQVPDLQHIMYNRLRYRLNIEFVLASKLNKINAFKSTWAYKSALCRINTTDEVLCVF